MFDETGRPTGYGQNSPFRDQPKQPGDVPPAKPAPGAVPPPPPPNMPPDPSMQAWRGGNTQRQLGQGHGQPPAAPPPLSPLQTAIGAPQGGNATGGLAPNQPPNGGIPPVPPGAPNFAMPQGDWHDPNFVNSAMKQANDSAYGGQQKHQDASYWMRPELRGDGAYIWDRMLGKGATGADSATAGQWAGGDREAMAAQMKKKRQSSPVMNAINPTEMTAGDQNIGSNPILTAVMNSLQQNRAY